MLCGVFSLAVSKAVYRRPEITHFGWSPEFEHNRYVFTAAEEAMAVCYLPAREYNGPNSIYLGIFLHGICLKIFIIFLGVNTDTVISLSAAV